MNFEASVHPLFSIPVWELDLRDALADRREQLIDQAVSAIRDHSSVDAPLRQSLPLLAHASPEWAEVAKLMSDVAQAVLDDWYRDRGYRVRDLRCWALAVDGRDAWDHANGGFGLMHNHPNSTLSSVLYLDLPADQEGTPEAGTVFADPLSHVSRGSRTNGKTVLPGRSLHLLVFPSWLEHSPARPAQPVLPRPRLTVGADYLT